MTARRQGSRTSLDKYARLGANSPTKNLTMDFCNSFWGLGDAGVDVLFTRLRGAMRTVDELKSYFMERYAIEEEYSKRLTKLSNMMLGRDEIGETREALDAIRLETGRQAGFHMNLARSIRNELEAPTTAFYNKQLDLKKNSQAKVEHEFRAKQLQEGMVLEKYEQERDQTHGREFPGLARAYGDTARRWESVWKDFCDQAQDVEEERLDFIKEILWSYANAISTVCVADDEACENWRTLLEQVDLDRDMENFVRDYGTGNQIPDAMAFLRQNSSDGGPSSSSSSSSKVTTHPARFNRMSRRGPPVATQTPPADAEVTAKSQQGQSSSRQTNGSSAPVASPGPSSRKSPPSDSQPSGSSSLNRHDTLTHQIDEFQKVVASTNSVGPSGLESPTSPTLGRNVAEVGPQRPETGSSSGFKSNHSPKSSQIISSPTDQAHIISKGSPQHSPRTPSSGQGSISKTANTGGSGAASTSPSSLAARGHDETELPPTPLSGHYIPPPPQQPPPQPSPAQQRRSWTAPAPPPTGPIPNLPGPPPPLPPQQPSHTLVDPPHNVPPSPQYYQSSVQQGYQQSSPYINGNRNPATGYNPPRAPSPQRQQPQPQYQLPQPQSRPPLTVQVTPEPDRPPSPLGTGQVTEDGMPILFYVQAIYDYTATIEEEFDFTTGDIIAVTATPEDGWWSGELLDENRRQKGRNVFPSNFVSLLE